MAEEIIDEVDELGVPKKKKEVDELGVPVKKKISPSTLKEPLAPLEEPASEAPSTGFKWSFEDIKVPEQKPLPTAKTYLHEMSEKVEGTDPLMAFGKTGFGKSAWESIAGSLEKVKKSSEKYVVGAYQIAMGDPRGLDTQAKAMIGGAAGAMHAAFGTIMHFTPVGAMITVAAKGVEELPYGDKLTGMLFAPFTTVYDYQVKDISSKTGIPVEELEAQMGVGEATKDVMSIADVIPIMFLGAAKSKGIKKAGELKEKLDNKEPFTPKDAADYTEVVAEFSKDKNNLVEFGEQTGLKLKNDLVLEEVAKPFTTIELVTEKIAAYKNSLKVRRPDLTELIEKAEAEKVTADMVNKGIPLNVAGLEKYFDRKKTEEISKAEIKEEVVEKKVEEKPLEKVEEVVAKEEIPVTEKVKEEATPTLLDKYKVEKTDEGLKITDKDGKEPSETTRQKVLREYEETVEYKKGKTAEEFAIEEGERFSNPVEFSRYVAEKSQNPREIMEEYQRSHEYRKEDHTAQFLEDYVRGIDPKSYTMFGDRNKITQTMAKRFFAKKGQPKRSLDELSMEISEASGSKIEPQDIVEYMEKPYERKVPQVTIDLQAKFQELTGIPLTARLVDKIISQELTKANKQYEQHLNREARDYYEAERQYLEQLRKGEIPPPEKPIGDPFKTLREGEVSEPGTKQVSPAERIQEVPEGTKERIEKVEPPLEKAPEKAEIKARIEEARKKTSEGLDDLLSSIGGKKEVYGEKRPQVIDALKKITEGLAEEFGIRGEELYKKVAEYVKGKIDEIFLKEARGEFMGEFDKAKPLSTPSQFNKPPQGQPTINSAPPVPPPTIAPPSPIPPNSAGKWFKKWHEEVSEKTSRRLSIKTWLDKILFNQNALSVEQLQKAKAWGVIGMKQITRGAGNYAKKLFEKYDKEVYGKLSKEETTYLNDIITARRTIELDKAKDLKGESRLQHTVLEIEGKKVPLTKELAEAQLKNIEGISKEMFDKLMDRADKYFEANRAVLKKRLDEGLITQETYDKLSAMDYSKRMYVERMMDWELLEQTGEYSSGEIRRLKEGSEDLLFDNTRALLEQNTAATVRLVFHNRANRALRDWANENKGNTIAEVDTPSGYSADGKPQWKELPHDKKAIKFTENDVEGRVIVDGEFYKSWVGSEPLIKGNAAKAIQWATGTRVLKYFATGINASFALRNLPKDIMSVSMITDAYSISPTVSAIKASIDVVKNTRRYGKAFEDYIKHGGGFDTLTAQGGALFTSPTYRNKLSSAGKAIESAAQFVNNWSEQIVRISVYEKMIEKRTKEFEKDNGRIPDAKETEYIKFMSANDARSYMDFNAGGTFSKAADNFFPYFNASMQGIRSTAVYAKTKPQRFAYKIAELGTVAAGITAYNMGYDEDDKKNGILGRDAIPPYVSANNFVFMLPWTKENKDGSVIRPYIKIPIWQTATPFKTFFDAITEWSKTGEFKGEPIMKAIEVITPIGGGVPTPPIYDAVIGYEANYDRFRDEKFWKGADVKPTDEYTSQTPQMFVDISKGINSAVGAEVSPERLKGAYGKVFTDHKSNIWSVLFSNAYDAVTSTMRDEDKKETNKIMSERFDEMYAPFKKSYYGEPTQRGKEEKLIKEKKLEENSRIKREEKDKVKNAFKKFKEADKEADKIKIRQELMQYAKSISKESPGAYKRIENAFRSSLKISDVKNNILVSVMYERSPEVQARIYYEIWSESNQSRRDSMEKDAKRLGIYSKRFVRELNRLKTETK